MDSDPDISTVSVSAAAAPRPARFVRAVNPPVRASGWTPALARPRPPAHLCICWFAPTSPFCPPHRLPFASHLCSPDRLTPALFLYLVPALPPVRRHIKSPALTRSAPATFAPPSALLRIAASHRGFGVPWPRLTASITAGPLPSLSRRRAPFRPRAGPESPSIQAATAPSPSEVLRPASSPPSEGCL